MKDPATSGAGLGEIKRALPTLTKGLSRRLLFLALLLALVLAASGVLYLLLGKWLSQFQGQEQLARYGYAGIFLSNLISTASIGFPLPGPIVTFVGGGLLNPLFVGLVAGVAEPLGELTGYGAGMAGRRIVERSHILALLEGWMHRHGMLTLFVFSAIPNPFVDIVGISAGASRYPVWKFLMAVWAGKTIKSLAVAYAGYWGMGRLFDLLSPF
ncbi:MAG: VTT domain-containing protein [Chloroflexi bacterium]|nr:VTT domain-containing protein [Chloroflexota bacterium]